MYNTQVYRIKNLVSNSPILYTVLKTAWVMMSTSWADMHVWNLIASTLVVPVLRWGSLQLTNDLVLGWQQITTNLGVSTTPQVCHIFLVSWFYVWTVLQVSEQATKLFCLNKFVCFLGLTGLPLHILQTSIVSAVSVAQIPAVPYNQFRIFSQHSMCC